MFDYVKNRYNPNPNMVKKSDFDENNLYVKFINAPYMILPKDLEEFKKTHKSKFWYSLNRFEKIYKKDIGELNFEIIKDKENLNQFLDKIFILFNKKWESEYLSTPWKCEDGFKKYKNAMMDLAENNEGFIAVLYGEEKKLLSYAYCLEDKDTVYFYQYTTDPDSMYRKYSLGKVLVHSLLKYVIETAKYNKFDFMNGEQSYKIEWAKQSEEVYFKIEGKTFKSYILYYIVKFKVFLQFSTFFRDKLKYILKLKDNIFGKC